ncbi:MAG: sigma-54-dependent Fis family transcriptional regulator [Alphaproteobacteria bacterium]|nr:sigma-54-dependent Fis family transcriptional regulator [Alphaproteobacteria bacterium]MCB9794547.1 sigma-54-dependent Fis family transcriptional regulator [Alphaproteobacteria bacterium]
MSRALVVDDEPGVRAFLSGALELADHDVDEAGDGEEALALLAKRSYDVVITDLKMPRMDGMQLLRAIKNDQPEVEVIMLTAHGNVESAVEAMRLGAFDYLNKPISGPAELRLLVERALERRRNRDAREAEGTGLPPLSHGAPAMQPVVKALQKVARTHATVLLLGETGSGKEVAARTVHAWSPRASGPFAAINCAALSESLLESELFGHERGAFTGADRRHRGRVELAASGTFFLDEVGELPATIQAKLLRVLQEKTFHRVGGSQELSADVRWIAATNRDLGEMVAEGSFREDLYHRLAVFPVRLPALRQRREDIVPLAESLLKRIGPEVAGRRLGLSAAAKAKLERAEWRGNVRELANTLERGAILAEGAEIDADDLMMFDVGGAATPAVGLGPAPTMEEAERWVIEQALTLHEGNRRKAADHLGIGLRTLYDKLKKFELS